MNPYRDVNLSSGSLRPPPDSPSDPHDSPAAVISPTDLSQDSPPQVAPSEQDGGQSAPQTSDQPGSPLPDPVYSLTPGPQSDLAVISPSSSNPYPPTPPSSQVSVIIPSPDLGPSPLPPHCSDDSCPDLECSICFSHFNNVFRCPKMLQCKHTFCLECLARINVKSAQPNAIQCPLCRSFTPLPNLGLPKLTTDSDVLSYLPAAMQRVYSIRFQRNKGKLKVKRSANSHRRWSQRSMNRSLDVGLPSPPSRDQSGGQSGGGGGLGDALFRLTGRPVCRAILLTSVVMMMVLLTAIVIILITLRDGA